MADQTPAISSDVTIVGGGLAGKAAAIQLARAGLKVVCVEPPQAARQPVGESLDWSAPELLKHLGLPEEDLLASQIATWKRHVTLKMPDGSEVHYVPTEWLGRPPLHINLVTLHVGRPQLDDEILKLVLTENVSVVREHATDVEVVEGRIRSIKTESGTLLTSPWFIDASGGGASLLGRKLNLPSRQYGPTKVAMWTYFNVPQEVEGTTLYMDPRPDEYLEWVWEIPVSPNMVSVGYVAPGAAIKAKRDAGKSTEEIFRQQLAKFSHFGSLLPEGPLNAVNITSFKCRVFLQAAGPNWLIAGEAASLVDPMTSNGVTAALRQAAEAAELILKFRKRGKLPWLARKTYSSRILQMAKFFNEGIEKIVYEPYVRNRIGLGSAGAAYSSPAWSMNVVYARLKPRGPISTIILDAILGFFRASASIYYRYCSYRRPPAVHQAGSSH